MSQDQKRPEATHRQRATLSAVGGNAVIGPNGWPMAMVTGTASDLVPTVQFGNLMVGPVSVTRWIEDSGPESVIEGTQEAQRMAEAVCGSERRIIQWSIDPGSRIINPANGQQMAPAAATPQPPQQQMPAQPVSGVPSPPPAQ